MSSLDNPDFWIKTLNLTEHPEGGFFSETYRSNISYNDRNLATSIYFLLKENQISKFHSLKSDEIWYYHYGSSIKIHQIINSKHTETILGHNIDKKEKLSVIIKAGSIFSAELLEKKSFSIISCVVSPGFDFKDFKLYTSNELLTLHPEHKKIILRLT